MKNDKPARILALSFLFLAITSVGSANAQSKDRDNPTPLTSNEISGLVDSDTRGNYYYYSFIANPGEISITLTVEPGKWVNNYDISFTTVNFSIFDRNAEELAGKEVLTSDMSGPKQAIARIEVTRRQRMVLSIHIRGGGYERGVGGKYRVRIDGGVDFGGDKSRVSGLDPVPRGNTDNPECLPKKGILRVRMKDGSIRRIDLSEAEEITIEPQVSNIDKRQSAEESFTIAGDLQKQGKYREAIENYTMAIELYPGHADAFYRRGEVKFILQDYRGAIEDYSRCIQFVPDESHFVYSKRGDARLNLQDYQGAIADYNEFFKFPRGFDPIPKGQPLWSRLGINLLSLLPIVHNNRGFAKNRLGDKAGACEDFHQSCSMGNDDGCDNSKKICNIDESKNAKRFVRKALALADQKKYGEAIENLTVAIRLAPEDSFTYAMRGSIKHELQDYRGACEDFRKACSLGYNIACEDTKKVCH